MLVVFDGLDGGGKTTLIEGVTRHYKRSDRELATFKFPSNESEPGRLIRRIFNGESQVARKAMIYLMTADALCRMDELRLASRSGLTIADRYSLSSGWVYQTMEGWGIDELYAIVRPELFVFPDHTFIVDIPPGIAMERIRARATEKGGVMINTMYENGLAAKREKYLAYAKMQPFGPVTVLDGLMSPKVLVEQVVTWLKEVGA